MENKLSLDCAMEDIPSFEGGSKSELATFLTDMNSFLSTSARY